MTQVYLSVITILEIERGILLVERRDRPQAAVLRGWMDDKVAIDFENRMLPIDSPVARRYAALHVPDPRSERDALIAATALVHGMSVVTRNVSDFEGTGVPLINPWEPAAGAWRPRAPEPRSPETPR